MEMFKTSVQSFNKKREEKKKPKPKTDRIDICEAILENLSITVIHILTCSKTCIRVCRYFPFFPVIKRQTS